MSARDYYAMVIELDTAKADALNKGAYILCGRDIRPLAERAGGDPENLNGAIDAAVDEVIAAFGGDAHLALYAALSAYGNAMHLRDQVEQAIQVLERSGL
jgi:hypothetical protein